MKTAEAIEIIKEYQKWVETPPELSNTGIYIDEGMPNREQLETALSKAVEVMGQKKSPVMTHKINFPPIDTER